MSAGFDPGALSSAFLAGAQLTAAQLDVNADRIPYFHYDAATNTYIECVVSPADLYTAMST